MGASGEPDSRPRRSEAFGVRGYRIDSADRIRPVLEEALAAQ